MKRTTGIPRSFLKTVDKASLQQTGADGEEIKPPSGVMVNADGDFVIAEPDKASWEQFQAKTKSSAAAAKAATEGDKELEERGLLCSIDKRMFVDPMKTPCCGTTYCSECITNALTYSDLVCPACQTDGVLFDDLKPDDETVAKMKEYQAEKDAAKTKERSKSPAAETDLPADSAATIDAPPADSEVKKEESTAPEDATQLSTLKIEAQPGTAVNAIKSQSPEVVRRASVASASTTTAAGKAAGKAAGTEREGSAAASSQNGSEQSSSSKKRPAEDALENAPKIPKGPKAMQQQYANNNNMNNNMMPNMPGMPGMMPGMNGMPNMPNMMFPMGGMNGFGPGPGGPGGMMGMNGMDMSAMMMGGMNGGMGMNPMMMNGMFNQGGNGGGFQNGGMMNGGGGRGGFNGNNNFGGRGGGHYNNNNNGNPMMNNGGAFYNQQWNNNNGGGGYGMNNFAGGNQGMAMGMGMGMGDDGAYFRQPVNPARHQSKQRRVRPSDYKQL